MFLHTSYYLEEVSEMKRKKEEEEDFNVEVNNNLLPASAFRGLFFSNLFTNLCNKIVIFRLGSI